MTNVEPETGLGLAVAVAVAVAVFVGVFPIVGVGEAVAVLVGVDVGPPHAIVVDELRGTGAVIISKSALLLSVSWQPLFFLTFP